MATHIDGEAFLINSDGAKVLCGVRVTLDNASARQKPDWDTFDLGGAKVTVVDGSVSNILFEGQPDVIRRVKQNVVVSVNGGGRITVSYQK